MDEFSSTSPTKSGSRGILFAVVFVIAVLVVLFALFSGGSGGTTGDPATVGVTDEPAPVLDDPVLVAPAAPALDN